MTDENKQQNQQPQQQEAQPKQAGAGQVHPQVHPQPTQKQGVTNQSPDLSNQLLEAFLKREKVALQEQETKENLLKQRMEHYAKNSTSRHNATMKSQSYCKHKKGGKLQRAGNVDYSVFIHKYVDQTEVIKCQLCGMKWRKNDTVEFLVRGDKKIKNHTGIGWAEARQMVAQSSNRPSSTEIWLNPIEKITPGETPDGELVTYEM